MSVAASDSAAPARQARIELADVFARYADEYFGAHGATQTQRKVARAIVRCRTAALGGHREWCQRCGYQPYLYHRAAGPPTKPVLPHPGKNPVATNRRSLSKT